MNICITCHNKTRITRYKKKMIEQVKLLTHLDESISKVEISFSILKKFSPNAPVDCCLLIKSQSESIVITNSANSEIRAFNLCLEQALHQLLNDRQQFLVNKNLKSVFPSLSLPPNFIYQSTNTKERRA